MLGHNASRAPFREKLLFAGEEEAEGNGGVLPAVDLELWREGMFQLCWHQHGGSGLALSFADALDLVVQDRDWLLERIGTQRSKEADALEKAARGRR